MNMTAACWRGRLLAVYVQSLVKTGEAHYSPNRMAFVSLMIFELTGFSAYTGPILGGVQGDMIPLRQCTWRAGAEGVSMRHA